MIDKARHSAILWASLPIWLLGLCAGHAEEPEIRVVVGSFLPEENARVTPEPSPLKSPFGVDFDRQGNMWIVELEGGRVHRRSLDGELALIAGDGSQGYKGDGERASAATFNGMHNVAVTPAGDVYIADSWNNCVRMIDKDTGVISTLAGTGEAGFSGDGGPAKKAKFDYVMCVTLNPSHTKLYLADLSNHRIRVIDLKTGVVSTVAGNGQAGVPEDGARAIESPLVDPRAVAVDSQERVYVLERAGHALRMVTPAGLIRTVAGTGQPGAGDGPANTAELNSPKHLCVDSEDNVYIADEANHLIRLYDIRQGTLSTVLGAGQGRPAVRLSHPHGVCFREGTLFVVDSGNNRILSLPRP
jgi:DNA-binding beta-propeller fold protein YncE